MADTDSGLSRWRGKVALVTGASSGIGAQVARQLAAAGLKVVLAARRRDRLLQLEEELGENALALSLDVTSQDSVRAGIEAIRERFSGLQVLVNNAGLGYQESLLTGSVERFREMLDVNVLGLCIVNREAMPLLRKQEEAHIFHLGSMAGHRAAVGSNLYGATKYAVRALTESLRQELHAEQLPIRVTSVSPGFVETEFHQRFYDSREKSDALYSAQKVLEPGDIADAILYALGTPPHVGVHDLLLRGTAQAT